MDDDPRTWLFDPRTVSGLVVGRRPAEPSAVRCVISDVVWHDVVRLLRWATADTGGVRELDSGRWWRLAAGCAHLLRRLPGLSDELGDPWRPVPAVDATPESSGAARVATAARRLERLLRSAAPVPLQVVAAEVDALGAAAVSALAERSSWVVPEP
jgi:hypothetical protein